MNNSFTSNLRMAALVCVLYVAASVPTSAQDLGNGLVSYWPLDQVQGDKTPDLVNGYDMQLSNLSAADLIDGIRGKCFNFSNQKKTLLSRVHGANEELPINKHAAFTISLWTKVNGTGQIDLRVFSEASTANSDPLFNIGTHSGGSSGQVDLLLRQSGWTTVDHIRTTGEPFDDQWHHVVFLQQEDGSRKIYIDGVADELEIAAKPEGNWNVNDTTIGGILRASQSHWVTGLIDDVALWKRALSDAEITKLKSEGLTSLFPPIANGLVAHWPLDAIQGDKTPDLVNGYDMQLNNLSAADLIDGIRGKCFSFSNQNKTLLSRVHGANDELPINKHAAFTVSLWTKVNGTGQFDLRVFSEGNTSNSDPLFNIGTHNTGANGAVDLFFRQGAWPSAHILTTGEPFDDQWHHLVFVQQEDGSRKIYIDGAADELEIAAKPEGSWIVNDTTIGGILRASPSHWITGLIDDVALWKRALTPEEINTVKTNGVPNVFTPQLPLEIKKFTADFSSVAQGDKVVLHWEASKDASLSISPGVGDVSGQTQFGAGSTNLAVNQTTTFTLTATRGTETLTAQTTVHAVSSVQANWRLIENFDFLSAGGIASQGNWLNPEGLFSVVDLGANKALGFDGGDDLAAVPLNSLTLSEGQKATLFFHVYVPTDDTASAIGVNLGLTEKPIRFNDDFGGNVGPFMRFERLSDGGTIDAQAHNGVGAGFDPVADVIQAGNVYKVWIDIENRPFDVGDLYSVHLAKEGANRATLFQDYVSDRDAVNIDPALGAPGTNLTHLFFAATDATQGVNTVLFDDFYLSSNGFNDSTPVRSSSFQPAPKQVVIAGFAYNAGAKSFTLTWTADPGKTYSVQKRGSLSTGAWTAIASDYPTGGATGNSVSFTDTGATGSAAFYQVVANP